MAVALEIVAELRARERECLTRFMLDGPAEATPSVLAKTPQQPTNGSTRGR
jgi:hypothetical protein